MAVSETTITPPVTVVQFADGGGPWFALLKSSKTPVVGNGSELHELLELEEDDFEELDEDIDELDDDSEELDDEDED